MIVLLAVSKNKQLSLLLRERSFTFGKLRSISLVSVDTKIIAKAMSHQTEYVKDLIRQNTMMQGIS